MSGDDFQTRYATVMDSMLKSAIAETTKLFETMVDELKAEISRIKKENEDLKSKCNEFENAQNHLSTNNTHSDRDPALSNVSDKRDTAVQCDLVPLGAVLVEKCHQFRTWSMQSQEEQREHDKREEQQCETDGEEESERAFILIKQEESDYDDSFPSNVLKMEDEETTLVSSETPGSPGAFVNRVTPEGSPIHQSSSYGGLTLLQKDEETTLVLETPCLAGESGLTCLGEAQGQGSEQEQPPVTITPPAVKDDMGEQFGVDQQITETSTQTEAKALEEQPLVAVQQQSAVQLRDNEPPSQISQQPQGESETLEKEQFCVVLNADVPSTNEQLSDAAALSKVRASEELAVGLAETGASPQPNMSVRRRRGRPPKRTKGRNSQKQPVVKNVLSPSIDIPTDQDVTAVQKIVNTPPRVVEKAEVSPLSVSTASLNIGCSSEKVKPKSQELPMEMDEDAIHSISIQVPSAVEKVATPSSVSPRVPPGRHRERHASYPSLQDAMLLVEAMNAQTSAYQPTTENAVLSPQIEVADIPQTQHTPPLVSLQTASVAPGQLTAPISPQTSAPPSAPQLSTTLSRTSFSLPTVGQSTTAQSSVTFGSPNQQSTSVTSATIKAIVMPKQQYAVIPSKTTASSIPPSTVATQTSVQPLQPRSLHPLITVVAPNKQLSNSAPQKIIVVPRPMSSFTPHTITALSPTQLSTVVSTVVAAQKNSLPPASTAAGLPLGASSLPSLPLKTIVVTSRQPMSPGTSQTTVTSADQQSVTSPHPKITIVVPRQGPAMVPRQQQSTVAAQSVVAARKQQSAEPPLIVAVSTAQSISLSQQSSVAVDVSAAPAESAIMSSQKWDNITDNLESPKKTAMVSKMTTESTEICLNLKKSVSPGIVQTPLTPKVPPVFQEKLSAVVKLTKLPLTVSTKEIAPVGETSSYCTETLTSLKDFSILDAEPDTTQEKPSAVVQSAQLSPAGTKELMQFANMPSSSTENLPSFKALPVALPPQASAEEPVAIQEKQLSAVKFSQSVPATSARKVLPDSMRATSSSEICSILKESPVTRSVHLSFPSKVSVAVLEKPLTTINVTQSTVEKALVSEATVVSTENSFSLNEVLISGCVQASVSPNEPLDQQEKPSAAPLRLTSIISKDMESDPHLQMTKTQFLAQLAVSPVFHVQQQALSSDAVDTSGADTETSTGNSTRFQKDSLVARLRSHLRTRLQASKAEPNPESFTETEPIPVSSTIPRLAKDIVTDGRTNSESSKVSPKRPVLVKDVATPEKTTNSPTSISPRRSRSSKDGARPKNDDEPTSVNPKRPRLSKDGASPKSESTSRVLSPTWPRLTKDAVSSKKTTSERCLLSRRWPRLAKGGPGPKKTRESIVAKKTRLIQDVTSPKKSIRVANVKKLAKATKAKTSGKMENSSQSKLQNGAETKQLADANHNALKKAKAKAVWTPPRMSANKSPLTRGRSVPLSPAKRDTRSQNQAQVPTTPQRRSQSTSPRMVTPPNQLSSTPPNNSQTVKLESASKGRPLSPRTVIYPPSVSLHPIPVKAPPVVSPLQPLSVIGRRLLKNQCGECGRVLSSAAALESHVSLHTGRRPFSCTFCGKSFPDSKGLTRHGRVHRNGRIHICSQCGKGFVYRFGLTKHLQMVHGRVKPFVCQICNKGFFSKRDVEAHIRVHTGEKPFHCNLCDKRFKRRVELNVHLRWHNGEKRHWCPYCGKGFLDFNNLKRHKYIHTGEKPHSCPHCSKNFTQSGHLKKHVKNVHKIK